jgi:Transposase DNA-binding/Transposase Tn5 dimerisation domain
MDSWGEVEFGSLDLGDVRRNRRFQKVAQTMWQSPQASAGGASGDWAEAKATYRLWETEEVTPQAILAAHRDQVLERAKPHRVLLHIQDTTELDFSKKKALQGAGPLSDKSRQGFFAHSEYVLQGDGVPLGLWYSHIYARSPEEHGKKSAARKKLPIEEKESYRWLEAYRRACELRALSPKQLVISLGDREADIYESLQEYHQRKERREPVAHFILRCKHDRNITPQPQDQAVHTHLKAAVAAAPLLGTMTLTIREKEQCKKVKGNRRITLRSARQAVLEIRACPLELIPPGRPKGRELTPIKIWVVMAKEINPPAGEEPIEWILLTDLSVRTLKKARQILHLYSQRWQIEVFHKILKSGCHAEKCQLKEAERLLPRLAMQMIIAWRIHAMTLLGRACPDLPCGVLFEEWEWKPVVVIFRGSAHESEEPSLAQMNEWVGRLGGHLGRKSDGPPGPQTIWKGLARVRDFGQLWIALHLSQHRG